MCPDAFTWSAYVDAEGKTRKGEEEDPTVVGEDRIAG